MNYTVGYVGVFLNGVRLSEQEFTATDGVSVVLDEPCALGDIVLIEGFLGSSTGNSAASSAFIQAGAGAVQRTSQNKMREWISVEDFGAVCDGITDDTAAVQAAISAAYNRWAVLRYPLAIRHGPVTVPANVAIVGVGGKSRITAAAGNYNLFTVVGSDVTFENLWIEDSLKTGGWDFVLACGTSTLERIALTNINTWNSFGLISDSGSGANGIHITTRFRSIQARQHRGQGVSMTRLFAFSFWNEVVIDYVNSASANVGAFVFDLGGLGPAAGGLIMRDCDVLGRNDVENNPLQNAFNIRNTAAVWLFGCRADTCGGFGLLLYNVNQFEAVAFSAGLCNNVGIYCENVTNSMFVNTRVFGRNFLSNKAANADGIALSTGCATLVFNGGFVRDCTGHGFNKNAIQAGLVKLNDFVLSSCLGYGLRSAGNSALLTLGCTFNANTAGNYTIGGIYDFIMASQLTSGAVITSVGPGPVSG
jgi:hypothetical protein